jgi:hypothetical protein
MKEHEMSSSVKDEIAARIKLYPQPGHLPCPVAHYIAAELGVTPLEVGEMADELGVRVTMCQLGFFGYAVKGRPAYRIRQPMENVPAELREAVERLLVDIGAKRAAPCAALWALAERMGLSRLEMGNAAEGLNVKVKPCQLGCF